jgi:hypothetical protein
MESENFSPKDSLQLIDSMINQAKNRFSENGFLYLFWGWLVLFCSVGQFILEQLQLFKHPEMIWMITWLAIIFQIFYLKKEKKKEVVKTYSENIINYIWVSFGICMFLLAIILGRSEGWANVYSLFLMLYGIPTFLSGVVMQLKSLKAGGISCWILAVIAAFVPSKYGLLFLAAAMVVAWIIPGYQLRKKFKNQND